MRQRMGMVGVILSALVGCAPRPAVVMEPTAEQRSQAEAAGYRFITQAELADLIHQRSNMVLIDARTEPAFARGHLLGATNFAFSDRAEPEPWSESTHGGPNPESFAQRLGKDLNIPVIVYDEGAGSQRSHLAGYWAAKLGYKDVRRFFAGLAGWEAAGEETRSLSADR